MKLQEIYRLKRATTFIELLGSLEIYDEKGETWRITAILERDTLFNRLIVVGKQRWENM